MKATDAYLHCRVCDAETLHARHVIGKYAGKRIDDPVVRKGVGRAAKIVTMRCVECTTRGKVEANA